MPTGIGLRIKQCRESQSMTQEMLSKKMGYTSKAAVCKVERGDDNITLDRVEKFAEALGVTPGYLMGWEDEEPDSDMVLIADYLLNPNEDITLLMTIAGKLSEDNLHKVIDIAEALLLTQTDNKN